MATLEAKLMLRDQFTEVLNTIDQSLDKAAQSMNSFKQQVAELEQVLYSASAAIEHMNATLQTSIDQVWNIIQPMTDRLMELFGNFGDQISSFIDIKDFVTKIVEGLTAIIKVVEKIENIAQSDLGTALVGGIENFDQVQSVLSKLVKASMESLKQAMSGAGLFKGIFEKIKTSISQGFEEISGKLNGMGEVFSGKNIVRSLEQSKNLIKNFFSVIKNIAGEGSQKFAGAWGKISGVFKGFGPQLELFKKAFQKLKEPISDVVSTIKEQFTKLSDLFDRLKGFLGFGKEASSNESSSAGGGFLAESFVKPINTFFDTVNGFAKKAANLALVYGIVAIIKEAAQALKDVMDKVPDDLGELAKKFGIMTLALAAMGVIVAVAGALADKNPAKAFNGLLIVAGLSINLLLAAEAMKQIDDNVPSDFGSFAAKIGAMALALASMGGLVAVAGILANLNPAAAIAGLVVIAAMSLELMLAAEAMKQIDEKVSDDFGGFSNKLANIALAIGGFITLATAIGAVIATGIGGAAIIAGMIAIAAVAGELMLMAEAILQVDEKVPDEFGNVEEKITNLLDVIQIFTNSDLGSIGDLLSNIVGSLNTSLISGIVDELVSVAENLQKIEGIEIADSVGEKIHEILSAVETINGEKSIFKTIGDTFKSGFDNSMYENVAESVAAITQIASDLSMLGMVPLPIDAITKKVEDLLGICDLIIGVDNEDKGFWSSLKDKFTSGFDASTFSHVIDSVNYLLSIASGLSALGLIPFDKQQLETKVSDILEIIDLLGSGEEGFWGKLGNTFGSKFDATTLSNVSGSIEHLIGITNKLIALAEIPIDKEAVLQRIKDIGEVIEEMNQFPELVGFEGMEAMVGLFTTLTETIMTAIQDATTNGMEMLATSIEAGVAQVKAAVENIKEEIVQAFNGLPAQLQMTGGYAMVGLANGIRIGAESAISAAQTIALRVASIVRQALDVHSPSRVMMEIGGFVSEGLAKGIATAQYMVEKTSDALALAAIPDQLATVSANGVISSSVQVDDKDISRIKASTSQAVIVQHKQVVPQVTVNVENNNAEALNVEDIVERVEEVILDAMDADLS